MGQSCGQMSAYQRQKDLRSFQLLARNLTTTKDVKRLWNNFGDIFVRGPLPHVESVQVLIMANSWSVPQIERHGCQKKTTGQDLLFFLGDNDN